MCGRFTLTASGEALVAQFGLPELGAWSPRYNIAPSQTILGLRADTGAVPGVAVFRWGLVPGWVKDPAHGARLINARAETVDRKPAFREAFRRRRCLVLADGYFEWSAAPGGRQPYYVRPRDRLVMTIAALWERWIDAAGAALDTCALLTTAANPDVAHIHARMPVVLPADARSLWLDPATPLAALTDWLAQPVAPDRYDTQPVSRVVNSPQHDVAACIEPGEIAPAS